MAELAVIGDADFVLGFQLIGIKRIFPWSDAEELKARFSECLQDKSVGIIVTDDKSIDRLDQNLRRQVENTVSPVIVTLSIGEGGQESLRDMIKKAIGIDLLR